MKSDLAASWAGLNPLVSDEMSWVEDKIVFLIGLKATCTFGSKRNIFRGWGLSETWETAASTVTASTYSCSKDNCYSLSLIFLVPFFDHVSQASPFSGSVWESGSPRWGCCWTWTPSGLPLSNPAWFRQFPCETLSSSNIVISHRGPGLSGYCLSAPSGPLASNTRRTITPSQSPRATS